MIEKIQLHNFQIHKDISIDCGQITTLIGSSDSGKSAVIRALNWVLFNKGSASSFLRRGAKTVAVQLTIDGQTVVRTSKNNAYKLNGDIDSTVGRTVPSRIEKLFNVISDNVQCQHDSLYWFNTTGAGVASNLNKVVDLTLLETWVKDAQALVRKQVQLEACATQCIEEQTCTIEHLEPVVGLKHEFDSIDGAYCNIQKMRKTIQDLSVCVHNLEVVSQQVQSSKIVISSLQEMLGTYDIYHTGKQRLLSLQQFCEKILKDKDCMLLHKVVSKLLQGIDTIYQKKTCVDAVSVIMYDLITCVTTIGKYKMFVQEMQCWLQEASVIFEEQKKKRLVCNCLSTMCQLQPCVYLDDLEFLKQLNGRVESLRVLCTTLRECFCNLEQAKESYKQLQDEFVLKTDGVCPLCGGVLHDVTT